MLSHIKDLFGQRKEHQQKRLFSNHFRKQEQDQLSTSSSQMNIQSVNNPPSTSIKKNTMEAFSSKKYKKESDSKPVVEPADTKATIHAADELVYTLVEQDKKRRSQLPHHPGMERFQIIRKLGDGAFSNVYEALDSKTCKKVAIKIAQKSGFDDKNTGQRHLHQSIQKKPKATERADIIKEVQIMRNVRHPNIVQLIHYFESPQNYFLTLELCEGGELFHQIVKMTYFSENLSRHVILQVASAVQYLHEECGVVHRDIKPENILFNPIPIVPSKCRVYRPTDNLETKEDEGEFIRGVGGGGIGIVKLADFGLSKVIWNNTTFTPCGTVGYTAPEIVCDQVYSQSVDMFSIGCVLYTILCGFPPFYDESINVLTEKVARVQYTYLSPWWDTISDSVKDLIRHLLCADVKKRYTIDQFFNHPWIKEEPFTKPKVPQICLSSTNDAPILTDQDIQKNARAYRQQQQMEQEELQAAVRQAVQSNLFTPPEIDQEEEMLMDDHNSYTTPDAATLREIFDVTYAVQRMGEEEQNAKDKKVLLQNQEEMAERSIPLNSRTVQVPLTQQSQNLPIAQKLAFHSRGVADPIDYRHHRQDAQRQQRQQRKPPNDFEGFQLDMNNATLLNNRKGANIKVT